ncbi:TRAP transporter small permease subunit [Aliiruegeria sabulilitoris]|uniref:TRAP transporter small permease subunit n=1 Tax=Aliiruegeria sabulilitoris TaxID=1510458 RepID=UPI00082D2A81|nr:TRAP transporter small permease [Aliiruegeria sabulilitoris]NDR59291.1 TRAP transporter small permease [Pseudoruegeria sp. M32A2M]
MNNGVLKTTAAGLSKMANGIAISANAVGTIVVLLLVLVVNYDVVARGIFNKPFLGAVEVVQFSMVLIVFLQLPDVVRVNRLTRSDGFLAVIGERRPRLARNMRRVINFISGTFMTLIAIAIWPEFTEMWESKDFFGIPGVFTAPWWPIKLVIFLSAALCVVIFALKVLTGRDRPEMIRAPEHEEATE